MCTAEKRRLNTFLIIAAAVLWAACVLTIKPVHAETVSGFLGNGCPYAYTDDDCLILGAEGQSYTLTGKSSLEEALSRAGGKRGLVKTITFIGDVHMTGSMDSLFAGYSKLQAVTGKLDTSQITSMATIFASESELTDISCARTWDVSHVTNMHYAFGGCSSLQDISPLKDCDVRNVTNMTAMFNGASNLQDGSVFTGWHVDSLTECQTIFQNTKITELDLSNWNLKNLSNASTGCLQYCNNLQKITFGENVNRKTAEAFQFPTPDSSVSTGKWIRDDRSYGPYTSSEVVENYSQDEFVGTWVWELNSFDYTIRYVAPEGASGSMPEQTADSRQSCVLSPYNFYRFNYEFDYWQGSDGKTYRDKQRIAANTFKPGNVLTLTAVLKEKENKAEFEGGVADFILHAGERLVFPKLPGGTLYQVWEETPSGWKLHDPENDAGTIQPNETADAKFVNEYMPGTTTVQLVATKLMDGKVPEDGAFTFQLKTNGNVVEEASNNATGTVLFKTLVFKQPGTYRYTISEVRGDNSDIDYDTHEETITIQVVSDGRGNLTATTLYDNDGAKFENITKPGTLTVKKETNGSGDPDEVFTFEIRLTDELGHSLDNVNVVSDMTKE